MRITGVIILFAVEMLHANTVFYDANFNNDRLNQPPVTDVGTNHPTGRFSDYAASPIVVRSFDQLSNRPVLFTGPTLSAMGFELARGTPDYTLDFDFETHDLRPDAGIFNISFLAPAFVDEIDSAFPPEVFFGLAGNGQMRAPDGQDYPLGWTDDQAHHLHIVIGVANLTNYSWSIRLDNNDPITGIGPSELGDLSGVQLSLGSVLGSYFSTNFHVAIDNVVIGTTTNFLPIIPLFSFSQRNGGEPQGGLVRDSAGNFYGTTVSGYTSANPGFYGTVFGMDKNGKLIWRFQFNGTNGAYPAAAITVGDDGFLYGTTAAGGNGFGTIFKMSRRGELAWSVPLNGTNGQTPWASLFEVRDQNEQIELYGTATGGGPQGKGTVFKSDASGKIQVLHSFTGGADGSSPICRLVMGDDGFFYGTAAFGGNGSGTVFRLSRNGQFTSIFTFDGTNGAVPEAGLTKFGRNTFYGTTVVGGTNFLGIVFRITSSGDFTALHSFGPPEQGAHPVSELVLGHDGNFYGTTYSGGITNFPYGDYGTIFRISPTGDFQKLANFNGGDGSAPKGPMSEGETGSFYGTASESEGDSFAAGGTVFCFSAMRPTIVIDPPSPAAVGGVESVISGKAKCDPPVTNVFYNINGGPWFGATTTNGWSAWQGAASLMRGEKNTIQAYAVSAFGDRSRTNTLRFKW